MDMGKGATLATLAITFIVVYVSVTQLMIRETNKMIHKEVNLLGKNVKGEISEGQYTKESSKVEKGYKKSISKAIKPLITEIQKVIGLLKKSRITNQSAELENLSKGLENATDVLKC